MCGWFSKHEMKAKKHHTCTHTLLYPLSFHFYLLPLFIFLAFSPSVCFSLFASPSFITFRQLGQKSQAFGSAGDSAIQHPVCHNTGSPQCGNCQLMTVCTVETCQPVSFQAKKNLPTNIWTLYLTNLRLPNHRLYFIYSLLRLKCVLEVMCCYAESSLHFGSKKSFWKPPHSQALISSSVSFFRFQNTFQHSVKWWNKVL